MILFSKTSFSYLLPVFAFSTVVFSSCKDEDLVAVGEPSQVYFEVDHGRSDEGSGMLRINIMMDKPQNVPTYINFKVEGNASAGMLSSSGSDYELITESPAVIAKGQTSTSIELLIHEDEDFEQQLENIIFRIDAVLEGNAILSDNFQQRTHVHEIIENDYLMFLEWESDQEEDEVDLNMYIELPNKELISADNPQGFEEITITNTRSLQQYFVDIWYHKGSANVAYQLKCLKAGEKEKQVLVSGRFNPGLSSKSDNNSNPEAIQNYLMIKEGKELRIY
jgi:hypothetical protein